MKVMIDIERIPSKNMSKPWRVPWKIQVIVIAFSYPPNLDGKTPLQEKRLFAGHRVTDVEWAEKPLMYWLAFTVSEVSALHTAKGEKSTAVLPCSAPYMARCVQWHNIDTTVTGVTNPLSDCIWGIHRREFMPEYCKPCPKPMVKRL